MNHKTSIACMRRYRMQLPSNENYATFRPEWVEWESELPYNKCRSCTFYNGTLSVYQVCVCVRMCVCMLTHMCVRL